MSEKSYTDSWMDECERLQAENTRLKTERVPLSVVEEVLEDELRVILGYKVWVIKIIKKIKQKAGIE